MITRRENEGALQHFTAPIHLNNPEQVEGVRVSVYKRGSAADANAAEISAAAAAAETERAAEPTFLKPFLKCSNS